MKTFAIADLHGRFDLLTEAIRRIEEASQSGGTIVFLGDYIDRGPQSAQIIERLMAGPGDPARWTWICLKGNHEDMCVGSLGTEDESWWRGHGGEQTLASYGQRIPSSHLEWMGSLPLMHADAHRVFVHAGVVPSRDLESQGEAVLLWMRYPPNADVNYPGLHIVHGHTPNQDGPEAYSGRTNLDTLAWHSGRLVVGVFDNDKAGSPVSFITVQGPHIQEWRAAA